MNNFRLLLILMISFCSLLLLPLHAQQAENSNTSKATAFSLPNLKWKSDFFTLSQSTESSTDLKQAFEAGRNFFGLSLTNIPHEQLADRWRENGIELQSYLSKDSQGNPAYFVYCKNYSSAQFLLKDPSVLGIWSIPIEAKLQGLLQQKQIPDYAYVDAKIESGRIYLHVLFHEASHWTNRLASLEACGANIQYQLKSLPVALIEIAPSEIKKLAASDEVQWLELPLPMLSGSNDGNRAVTQADIAHDPVYDLDGTGVQVLVFDAGVARALHPDFGGRLIVGDNAAEGAHPTHVAGTVGGDGTQSGGQFTGMAPAADLVSYSIGGISPMSLPFVADAGDIEADYDEALSLYGVTLANNSIGANVAQNGYPCDIIGDYGVTAMLIDSMVNGSLGEKIRIIWASGNERGPGSCGTTYETIPPPAGAKNHIGIGAINSNDLSITDFTSWGPTDDGRLKPELSGPGCQNGGDNGVTSLSLNDNYTTFCGTSMAAPTVTGLCALLLEDYRLQNPGAADPEPALLKAVLMHSAEDLGNPGPDYQFGYGRVQIVEAIEQMRTSSYVSGSVQQGSSASYSVSVQAGDPELRATLVWDDAPGVPNISPALVNDLELVVTSPSGVRFYPWTLDPASPSANAIQSVEDHLNNYEQVLVDSPEQGIWTIEIVGFAVGMGPQEFSLTVTPDISALELSHLTPVPTTAAPQEVLEWTVRVRAIGQSLVTDSLKLKHRYHSEPYATYDLTHMGGELYLVQLPATQCGAEPEFYFELEGSLSGFIQDPPIGQPAYQLELGEQSVFFEDDFQTDQGWQAGSPGDTATSGLWERGEPNGTSAQPELDHTGNMGNCFFTGQGNPGAGAGQNDIDGGFVTLTSPVINVGGSDATISYWRWYSNSQGQSPQADVFRVEITGNGGANWEEVETVGPAGPGTTGGWFNHEFLLSDVLPLSQDIQLRFIAADENAGSLVEAAIDDLRVSVFGCEADCNGNQIEDFDEISSMQAEDLNSNFIPDICECSTLFFIRGDVNRDFNLNLSDALYYLSNLFQMGPPPAVIPSGDINSDGSNNLADVVFLLEYLFLAGVEPAAPFAEAGCGD